MMVAFISRLKHLDLMVFVSELLK